MLKKIFITSALIVSVIGGSVINSNATTWSNVYGTCSGYSSTTTAQYSGSPKYRIVKATTTCSNAAPNIASEVHGYVNGTLVLNGYNTGSNTTSVTASASSTNYVNSSVHGNGVHAVYSSTLARKNYTSSF